MINKDLKAINNKLRIALLKMEFKSTGLEFEVEKLSDALKIAYLNVEKSDSVLSKLKDLKNAKNNYDFKILKLKIETDISLLSIYQAHDVMDELMEKIDFVILKNLNFDEIFVVHGHDEEMKDDVEQFILDIGLKPIIFHKALNHSRSIIQKLNDLSNVNFVIILLSGDDYGYSRYTNHENAKLRARQNVIFEMGFFLGKIGQNRTFSLFKSSENFEFPSDLAGVLYEPYDANGNWKVKLIEEIKLVGYNPND